MIREFPAYGRTIASHIVRGQRPIVVAVLLSTYWHYFNHVPKVCIKPDEWALRRYEFGFLRGLHVVVVPGDGATELQFAELLIDLMRAGPSLLWAFDVEGRSLYDGDFASDVGGWATELVVRAGAIERLPREVIKAAEHIMAQAQARAAEMWHREWSRAEATGGVEASVRFALREYELKDRVRALFAPPGDSDARAA